SLEPGRLEAVTLVENGSRFEWSTPFSVSQGPRLTLGDSVELLRPTRPPALYIPRTPIVRRAEQGANFLRTYFPDIDVTAELVRQELSTDAQIVRDWYQYDYSSRNMLEPLHIPDAPPTRQFLAFPMGITGSDLNIGSYDVEDNLDFEFSADPVASFATPILQITSSRTSTTDA
ncbi:hypothetical protein EV360DRAFT_22752, partial [Lentinula raphanica]